MAGPPNDEISDSPDWDELKCHSSVLRGLCINATLMSPTEMVEDLSSSMTECEVAPRYLVSKLNGHFVAYNNLLVSGLRLIFQLHSTLFCS
jgi:hypothetical protein